MLLLPHSFTSSHPKVSDASVLGKLCLPAGETWKSSAFPQGWSLSSCSCSNFRPVRGRFSNDELHPWRLEKGSFNGFVGSLDSHSFRNYSFLCLRLETSLLSIFRRMSWTPLGSLPNLSWQKEKNKYVPNAHHLLLYTSRIPEVRQGCVTGSDNAT